MIALYALTLIDVENITFRKASHDLRGFDS